MIDRLAALADIAPPQPAAPPPAAAWWNGPPAWIAIALSLVALAAALPSCVRMLRRRAARRRLRDLGLQIRAGTPPQHTRDMAQRLLAAAEGAGIDPHGLPPSALARRDQLLYGLDPELGLLAAFLDDLLPR